MSFTYTNGIVSLNIELMENLVTKIDFIPLPEATKPASKSIHEKQAVAELDEYFSGKRFEFEMDYLLEGTEFQVMVWNELLRIPYGDTISYSELARRVKRPKAFRAVANALNANPLPIILPCHRVIGKDGSLRGFGGGLNIKSYLLNLEQKYKP